jgi:hypothetical protein
MSSNDKVNNYIRRTQNYEMMSCQYLPSYAFRKFCGGMKAIGAKSEYPREIKNMYFESQKYE